MFISDISKCIKIDKSNVLFNIIWCHTSVRYLKENIWHMQHNHVEKHLFNVNTQHNHVEMQHLIWIAGNIIISHADIIISHVDIIMLHVTRIMLHDITIMLHVTMIMLHVDMNKSHVNIIYVYLAYMYPGWKRQKYTTIVYIQRI